MELLENGAVRRAGGGKPHRLSNHVLHTFVLRLQKGRQRQDWKLVFLHRFAPGGMMLLPAKTWGLRL
jgi:hypothetical protein